MKVWGELRWPIAPHLEQHHYRPAHILPHFGILVIRKVEQVLEKVVEEVVVDVKEVVEEVVEGVVVEVVGVEEVMEVVILSDLDELVDMKHERLAAPDDELVDAGDRVAADLGRGVAEEGEELGDQHLTGEGEVRGVSIDEEV